MKLLGGRNKGENWKGKLLVNGGVSETERKGKKTQAWTGQERGKTVPSRIPERSVGNWNGQEALGSERALRRFEPRIALALYTMPGIGTPELRIELQGV